MDDAAPNTIGVTPLHTAEQLSGELDQMLSMASPVVCLGHIMALRRANSPYIIGGDVTEDHVLEAADILDMPKHTVEEFHRRISKALATCWRIFEIIPTTPDQGTRDYAPLSPEWLADIIAGVCHVMPSATYEEILWKLPFAAVAHLIAASYRAIGKHTSRPFDIKAALAALEKSMGDRPADRTDESVDNPGEDVNQREE